MTEASTLTQEDRARIAAQAYANPVFFCKFFLEKWFPKDIPWVHRGLLAILSRKCDFLQDDPELDLIRENFVYLEDPDDDESPEVEIFTVDEDGVLHMALGKFTLLLMPRGFSKTTIANAMNIYNVVFQDCKYPLYTSETGRHAERQLTNVSRQLTSNPRIKLIFGDLRPDQRNEEKLKWSESDGMIQTTTGITLSAVGRGGQVRGTQSDAQRPDRLTIDDVENKESVSTEEQRKKAHEWFYGDLLPAMPEMDDSATAVMLATLLHSEALALKVARDPEWTVIRFGVLAKNGKPLWPEMMDEKKIEKKKRRYALQNLLHIFYLEYYNQIRNPDDAKFKGEYIRYEPLHPSKLVLKAIVIDPAISERKQADFCGFAVVGMRESGVIQVLDTYADKGMSPRAQVDKYFELKFRWGLVASDKHGVESQAYQAALVHLLREEMFRKHKEHGPDAYFEVIPITQSSHTKKTDRVEGILQPRYAAGYMVHQKRFPLLETQLLDWPNGKKDLPDVLAMAVSLLDPAAAWAAEEDPGEDQYEDLDEVMGGDWRQY